MAGVSTHSSTGPDCIPEPNPLTVMEGATVSLMGGICPPYVYFVIQDSFSDENLVMELDRKLEILLAKNMFGETMYSASGNFVKETVSMLTDRGDLLGWLNPDDKMYDNVSSVWMRVKLNSYNSRGTTTDYFTVFLWSTKQKEREAAYIQWKDKEMELGFLEPITNIQKGLVLVKAVHLAVARYGPSCMKQVKQLSYLDAPRIPGGPLSALQGMGDVVLVAVDSAGEGTRRYAIRNENSSQEQLSLEYKAGSDQLIAKNCCGATQFYVNGLAAAESNLCVTLHGKLTIGLITNGEFYNDSRCKIMKAESKTIPFDVLGNDDQVYVSIRQRAPSCDIHISFKYDLSPSWTALVVAYVMKSAFLQHGYVPNCNAASNSYQYQPYTPMIESGFSSLTALECATDVTLRKLGQNNATGCVYFELRDLWNEESVMLTFEVTQQLETVDAVANDKYGCAHFSAFGLWGKCTDLLINLSTGAMLGLCRGDYIFDHRCRKLLQIRSYPGPGAELDSEEQPSVPSFCKLFDARQGHDRQQVAMISENDDDEVLVEFSESAADCDLTIRALIISYALKLAYIEFHHHEQPRTEMAYKYVCEERTQL